MRSTRLLVMAIFLGAALRSVPVQGQVTSQNRQSQVTLSLDEFEELFSSARLEEAERRLLDQRKMHEAEHRKRLAELQDQSSRLDEEAKQQRDKLFPENYQVLQHTASGYFNASSPVAGVERDVASFSLELTLRVLDSRWTAVPIANTTSTVASDWNIAWRDDVDDEFRPVDPVTCPDVLLLQRDTQQILATNRSGLFKIQFKAHSRVGKTRNLNKLGLSSLLYPLSDFSLRVAAGDEPGFDRDFSVQPTSAVLDVHPSGGYTDIKATLPLTADSIEIRWLDIEEAAMGGRVNGEAGASAGHVRKDDGPQVTAIHDVLHAVGEGIIRSSHILEFSASGDMSTLNSVSFVIHGEVVRVISVEGHALQHWEAHTSDTSSQVVQASFKSSHIDSTATLLVHTESDRPVGSSTNHVELSRIECRGVLRQGGHVAVIKDANVEVHEHSTRGLTPCEPTELSTQLRFNIDRPIVLSYKYLNPQNSVVLSVKEHEAVGTLEATIDRVHYKAVVTDTHTIHSLMVIVQSTKLQYLELLGLPSTASMFTLMINSVPAKPVQGESGDNTILVPLLIGLNAEAANEGLSMLTSVEVNYVSTHQSLGRNGTLSLSPPRFTLPISVLTTHLRLPQNYKYEFSGDFNAPAMQLSYPIPSAFSYKTGKRLVEENYEFTVVDDMWPEDDKQDSAGAVKIFTPNMGRSFHFQRLLVVDTKLTLNAAYSEPVPVAKGSWWSQLMSRLVVGTVQ